MPLAEQEAGHGPPAVFQKEPADTGVMILHGGERQERSPEATRSREQNQLASATGDGARLSFRAAGLLCIVRVAPAEGT